MNKDKFIEILIDVLYICAFFEFLTYLFTKKSVFMFCGGVFLILASTILIIHNKNKK